MKYGLTIICVILLSSCISQRDDPEDILIESETIESEIFETSKGLGDVIRDENTGITESF